MQSLSEKERKRILESSPTGTWALMLMAGIGMVLSWLFLYFGVFVPRGIVD